MKNSKPLAATLLCTGLAVIVACVFFDPLVPHPALWIAATSNIVLLSLMLKRV